MRIGKDFLEQLETVRLWDGNPDAGGPARAARRATGRSCRTVETQLREAKAGLTLRQPDGGDADGRALAQLTDIAGDWSIGSWTLATEIFGWRQIRNGRQLGALVGLVPSPYQSGETHYEQGITAARATSTSGGSWCNSLGAGCTTSRIARYRSGINIALLANGTRMRRHWDCRAGAQTLSRAVAVSRDWCGARGRT